MHFLIIGVFAITLLIVAGTAIHLNLCRSLASNVDSVLLEKVKRVQLIAFIYCTAGIFVVYTSAVSCLIEVGNP